MAAKPIGLKLSQDKSKYMIIDRRTRDIPELITSYYTF